MHGSLYLTTAIIASLLVAIAAGHSFVSVSLVRQPVSQQGAERRWFKIQSLCTLLQARFWEDARSRLDNDNGDDDASQVVTYSTESG